jgi:hypothetical protein
MLVLMVVDGLAVAAGYEIYRRVGLTQQCMQPSDVLPVAAEAGTLGLGQPSFGIAF